MAKKKTKIIYPSNSGRTIIPVLSHKHKDKRVNIPTEELRDFVAADEKTPKTMLYPRDPSLDPQLVWKGKDDQDAKPLEVPVVPIYIQEKIHPQALVEDVRAQAHKEKPEDQFALFGDFNGIKFEEMIDFYQHEQSWTNRIILGDSLLVMASLAEKEGLKGKVQAIYFDPPYGIKFGSNWQVSTRKRDVKDGKAEDTTRQPEQVKAFRDTWQLGIHSYLAYLRDRLAIGAELLTESGSIFVQIGEENVHLVRSVLDDVFGSENSVSLITVLKRSAQPDISLPSVSDYVLWYCKNKQNLKYRQLYIEKKVGEIGASGYDLLLLADGTIRRASDEEIKGVAPPPKGAKFFTRGDLTSSHFYKSPEFDFNGKKYSSGKRYWSTSINGLNRLAMSERILANGSSISYARHFDDFPIMLLNNIWTDTNSGFMSDKIYVVQTLTKIIERCILMTTDPGDLVIDPTCGGGTTAFVAEEWGRRWITVDTSRVALALTSTRLMTARYPYYYLADSKEGAAKNREISGNIVSSDYSGFLNDIKKGFVYKHVPHVTLKAIANNVEIEVIYEKWRLKLNPLLAELNKELKQSWEEWQVPRQAMSTWSEKARSLHSDWWQIRRSRLNEINDVILRQAEQESLVDQPCEDSSRVRVSGPFTVESLSPHRVLSSADENLNGSVSEQEAKQEHDFVSMILDNLRKAGVQNTMRKERLTFERLESFAGVYLQATGEYLEEGKRRRCAIHIGPEHGTVGPVEVKEAAKEAVQGVGFDLLIVCGFAFDPHVAEEAKRYGKLTVLTARMNPDLAMGDELLKKTGAGNLFMVFGEPDIEIKKVKDDKIVATIKGLDVYDPTTGQIRSSSTDDIACWFIDTNYNGESFFVRHAYFTGADEPYEKLKRALRAEIDEAAWSALYSTKSRPFDAPKTGKIAVKVINHYGDEVLKVFETK